MRRSSDDAKAGSHFPHPCPLPKGEGTDTARWLAQVEPAVRHARAGLKPGASNRRLSSSSQSPSSIWAGELMERGG